MAMWLQTKGCSRGEGRIGAELLAEGFYAEPQDDGPPLDEGLVVGAPIPYLVGAFPSPGHEEPPFLRRTGSIASPFLCTQRRDSSRRPFGTSRRRPSRGAEKLLRLRFALERLGSGRVLLVGHPGPLVTQSALLADGVSGKRCGGRGQSTRGHPAFLSLEPVRRTSRGGGGPRLVSLAHPTRLNPACRAFGLRHARSNLFHPWRSPALG